VTAFYGKVMEQLRGSAYARSDFEAVTAERLDENLTMVRATGVWRGANGAEMQRFGVTYTLRFTGGAWKEDLDRAHSRRRSLSATWPAGARGVDGTLPIA
jgi:hypothetical protein